MVYLNYEETLKLRKGDKVLIVEDVITTGKSSMECSKLVASSECKYSWLCMYYRQIKW